MIANLTDQDRARMSRMSAEDQETYMQNQAYFGLTAQIMHQSSDNQINDMIRIMENSKKLGPQNRKFQKAMEKNIQKLREAQMTEWSDIPDIQYIGPETDLMKRMKSYIAELDTEKYQIGQRYEEDARFYGFIDHLHSVVSHNSRGGNYKGVKIKGDLGFKQNAACSIEFALQKALYYGNMICNYIDIIKFTPSLRKKSDAWITTRNKTVYVKNKPAKYHVLGFSSMLVHEAMHSKLYWDTLKSTGSEYLAGNASSGEDAERKCCYAALEYNVTLNPNIDVQEEKRGIEEALKTRWWEK